MPLPLKHFRVLPNPWLLMHHELGPQCAKQVDPAGREPKFLAYVGAQLVVVKPTDREDVKVGERTVSDPRGDGTKARFIFPSLKPGFLEGTPIEVSSKSAYYRQALENGEIVPADEATAKAVKCMFASLGAAKADAVGKFDGEHGTGTWAELEKLLKDENKPAKAPGKGAAQPDGGNV